MRSRMASARVASEIFLCQPAGANWEQKMVEAFLWRAVNDFQEIPGLGFG